MKQLRQASRQSPEALLAADRLGRAVCDARKRRRLTQAQVADRAGLSRLTVINLERGLPGLAMGSFLEVLLVLEKDLLDDLLQAVESDPLGAALERARLPARVVPTDDF